MKSQRKRAPYITRLKYACKWLFSRDTAYHLGKEVYSLGLTGINEYKCCKNKTGELAIYQWAKQLLSNVKPYTNGFKFKKRKYIIMYMAKKLSREELIRRIRILENVNKRQKKKINEIEQINDAQREIIKIYVPKIKKETLKKVKEQKCSSMSWRKFLKGIGINRSTFYLKHVEKTISARDEFLVKLVRLLWIKSNFVYGRDKLLIDVNDELNKKRLPTITDAIIRRIMILAKVKSIVVRKTKKRCDPKNTNFKTKNLIKRNFVATSKHQKIFTDVTYLATPTGYFYISSALDTYDNKICSWNISVNNDEKLILSTFLPLKGNLQNCIVHSDHGSTYTSYKYQEFLKSNNAKCSMSRVGNSLDNYPIEHHFSFLKLECLENIPFEERTLKRVKNELTNYYKWFNNSRITVWKDHNRITKPITNQIHLDKNDEKYTILNLQISEYNMKSKIGPQILS